LGPVYVHWSHVRLRSCTGAFGMGLPTQLRIVTITVPEPCWSEIPTPLTTTPTAPGTVSIARKAVRNNSNPNDPNFCKPIAKIIGSREEYQSYSFPACSKSRYANNHEKSLTQRIEVDCKLRLVGEISFAVVTQIQREENWLP